MLLLLFWHQPSPCSLTDGYTIGGCSAATALTALVEKQEKEVGEWLQRE